MACQRASTGYGDGYFPALWGIGIDVVEVLEVGRVFERTDVGVAVLVLDGVGFVALGAKRRRAESERRNCYDVALVTLPVAMSWYSWRVPRRSVRMFVKIEMK